ncbi:MAG: hypothetical protein GY754_31690 [bacterium]|nr:hypothetical protein [bacterium]
MSSNNQETKYSYSKLSEEDQEVVDLLVGNDLYNQLPNSKKRRVLIWNTERRAGMIMLFFTCFIACFIAWPAVFNWLQLLGIPFYMGPLVVLVLLITALFKAYRGIFF